MDFDFDLAPGGSSAPRGYRPLKDDDDELPQYLSRLNPPQREAALKVEGPLIVLAGAGSGKTRMLTSRVAYLIGHCKVPAYQVLAVTFTNKAAREMAERVTSVLAESGHPSFGRPEIGTFHATCVRILRRELDRLPFTGPFVIYDDSDQRSLIKTVMIQMGLDTKSINPKAVQGAINRAKCDALEPQEIDPSAHSYFEKRFKEVYENYQRELFRNNALDFGEIITLTYRLLRDHPDVRSKYQRRFQYIHVDEYQDTNRSQYLLLSMLAGERHGGHQNICVVGDEDQSIYAWRGADIRNILDFEADFPGAKVVKLEQNYRSTQRIITAASHLIGNNSQRKSKELWTKNAEGEKVVHVHVTDERAEAEYAVDEIKRLARDDGRSFDEFAIFYRTHAQSRQFEDVLRREKIQYEVIGGLRFYDRKEIKDVLAYLKLLMNPSDSVSLKRIINVPTRGIGKTSIEKIDEIAAEVGDYWETLKKIARGEVQFSPRGAKKIGSFVSMIERLMKKKEELLLTELYHRVLDETAYVQELKKEGSVESQARIENLEEFNTILQEFEEERFKGLSDAEVEKRQATLLPAFIEQSSLVTGEDKPIDPTAVRLMTLHGAKGLEFPIVMMVGLEEGLFPSLRPWEETDEEDIEEERRLCYVGMTRARERLYMMNAAVRRLWGNFHYQDPARFLTEIPGSLINYRDLAPTSPKRDSDFETESSDFNQDVEYPGDEWVGRRIEHPEYGKGHIVSVEGSGSSQKAVIQFKRSGKRKFVLRFVLNYLVH